MTEVVIGVLALQGAFLEHLTALRTLDKLINQSTNPSTNPSTNVSTNPSTNASTNQPLNVSIKAIEVRTSSDLSQCDGLIIPGGESTAIALVAARENILGDLQKFTRDVQKPVFGTCAGLILMANTVSNQKQGGQQTFGGMDVEVQRNHYGTQLGSFKAVLDVPAFKDLPPIDQSINQSINSPTEAPAVFIRAPGITRTFSNVEILASVPKDVDSAPAKQGLISQSINQSGEIDHTSSDSSFIPVAVRQGNKIGTTFHPELTGDLRWHQLFVQIVAEAKSK